MNRCYVEFFAFLLLWSCLLPQLHYPVQDGDYYWHIRSGDYILVNQELPEQDPFSFTTPDKHDLDENANMRTEFILTQYWLAQIVMSKLHSLFGEYGVIGLRVFLFGLLLPLLYLYGRRSGKVLCFAFVFIAGSLLTEYPSERPQLFSFVLMPLVLFLLEKGRLSRLRVPRELLVLPPVMLLWANLHGSYLLGLVLCLVYIVVSVFKRLYGQTEVKPAYLSLILLAALSSIMNPNGLNALWAWFHADPYYIKSIYENLSPWEVLSYGHYYPSFWICLLSSLAVLMLNWRRMTLEQIVVLACLMLLALSGLRYMVFLALGLLLLLPARAFPKKISVMVVLCAIALVFSGVKTSVMAGGVDQERFPVQAVGFMRSAGLSGRVFSFYDWGGYVGYYLPGAKVFIDGRGLSAEVNVLYEKVMAADGWQHTLDEYKVDFIVIPGVGWYNGKMFPIIRALTVNLGWDLIYWDEVAVIFARTDEISRMVVLEKKYVHRHVISRVSWLAKRGIAEKEALLETKVLSQMALNDLKGALETYGEIVKLNENSHFARKISTYLEKIEERGK